VAACSKLWADLTLKDHETGLEVCSEAFGGCVRVREYAMMLAQVVLAFITLIVYKNKYSDQ